MPSHISKILDISTAHLPEQTRELAEAGGLKHNCAMKSEYAFLFHVPRKNNDMSHRDGVTCDALAAVMDYARDLGCEMVMFDVVSDPIDDLPVFDVHVAVSEVVDVSDDEMEAAEQLLQI